MPDDDTKSMATLPRHPRYPEDVLDEGPFPETIVVMHLDGESRAYIRADGPELQETIDKEVSSEREACALECERPWPNPKSPEPLDVACARRIRARTPKEKRDA